MYQISESELTNRINTFMARKTKRLSALEAGQRRSLSENFPHSKVQTPTLIEKINELWVYQIRT